MSLFDSIKMAFSSIVSHKLRSFLTMLGIMIGVGSVIMVVAIGQGGEAALKSQIAGSGHNTLSIHYRAKDDNNAAPVQTFQQNAFTGEDVVLLKDIPEVKGVIASNQMISEASFQTHSADVTVEGMSPGYEDIHSLHITAGQDLAEKQIDRGRKVALINKSAKEKLFESENPVGKIVTVQNTPLQVLGVFQEEQGGMFNVNEGKVIIPQTVWPIVYGTDAIDSLTVQAVSADAIQSAGDRAVELLNERHHRGGEYYVLDIEMIQQSISSITTIMTTIIGGIAAISLFVGGIGVMNIMLVSVTERTKEIGIRKALGATKQKILLQFLIEAVVLTTIGGTIGIAIGIGGAYIVSIFANWPPLISWPVVLGGVLFSMVIGVVFGLLPANKAAKLDPIEALRYE